MFQIYSLKFTVSISLHMQTGYNLFIATNTKNTGISFKSEARDEIINQWNNMPIDEKKVHDTIMYIGINHIEVNSKCGC